MKKLGYIVLSFVPILSGFALEFVAAFFVMGLALFSLVTPHAAFSLTLNNFLYIVGSTDFTACVSAIFSMCCIALFGSWYLMRFASPRPYDNAYTYSNPQPFAGDYNYGNPYMQDAHSSYAPMTFSNTQPVNTSMASQTISPRHTFHPLAILGIILMVPGAQYLCSLIAAATSAIHPAWMDHYLELIEQSGLETNISALMLLYAILLAPLGEELLFRGVTMHTARLAMPFWVANLLQAMLFGIFHLNVIQGVYAFALALLLGVICNRCGILYSILLHILFNLYGTVLSDPITSLLGDNPFAYIALYGVSILIFILGIIIFIRSSHRNCQ